MEYISRVRDASRSSKEDKPVLVNGYHGCMVVACQSGKRKTVPLALELWSSRAPGHTSENDEVLSQRLSEEPQFASYAIADGLKRIREDSWEKQFCPLIRFVGKQFCPLIRTNHS